MAKEDEEKDTELAARVAKIIARANEPKTPEEKRRMEESVLKAEYRATLQDSVLGSFKEELRKQNAAEGKGWSEEQITIFAKGKLKEKLRADKAEKFDAEFTKLSTEGLSDAQIDELADHMIQERFGKGKNTPRDR